jgi:hypothetical protein
MAKVGDGHTPRKAHQWTRSQQAHGVVHPTNEEHNRRRRDNGDMPPRRLGDLADRYLTASHKPSPKFSQCLADTLSAEAVEYPSPHDME